MDTFISRLRLVLFEVALGIGTTLDEQREEDNPSTRLLRWPCCAS